MRPRLKVWPGAPRTAWLRPHGLLVLPYSAPLANDSCYLGILCLGYPCMRLHSICVCAFTAYRNSFQKFAEYSIVQRHHPGKDWRARCLGFKGCPSLPRLQDSHAVLGQDLCPTPVRLEHRSTGVAWSATSESALHPGRLGREESHLAKMVYACHTGCNEKRPIERQGSRVPR